MLRYRVIPCLLFQDDGLFKTIKFKNPNYVGDPLNAIKIFNEKEVDELIFLDINASKNNKEPNFDLIKKIATECFMPFCYGGGIKSATQVKKLFSLGAEKVSINSSFLKNESIIKELSDCFGSQSIVVSIDSKKTITGKYRVYDHCKKQVLKINPVEISKKAENLGAGEILINSVDRDGTMNGFDLELVKSISKEISIPVTACGGAKNIQDLKKAIQFGGASAVAAGSMFIYKGKHRAVLINYPDYDEIKDISKNGNKI